MPRRIPSIRRVPNTTKLTRRPRAGTMMINTIVNTKGVSLPQELNELTLLTDDDRDQRGYGGNYNRNRDRQDRQWEDGKRRKGGRRDYQRQEGQGFEGRPDRPKRAPMEEIDFNSNYRLFYCKDHKFFLDVIQKETAPFLFKILMFPPEGTQVTREFENELYKELKDYLGS